MKKFLMFLSVTAIAAVAMIGLNVDNAGKPALAVSDAQAQYSGGTDCDSACYEFYEAFGDGVANASCCN